jgi:16S rRNA G1207 methylase RsmC
VAIALDRGAPVRGWIEGGVLSDTVDVAATLLAGDSIPADVRRGVLALGAGSAVLGVALSRALDEPVPRGEVQAPEAALTGHS